MKVLSTNIGKTTKINWQGREVLTGIYKEPASSGIYLETMDVKGDHVIDRRFHGGADKACYLYSENHYPFWREKYPHLMVSPGMFGENLTVEGLDEREIKINDVFSVGDAQIQVTSPRQPCFKLGIRFNDQKILKQLINTTFSGVYVRVLQEGLVQKDATIELINRDNSQQTIAEVFYELYHKP